MAVGGEPDFSETVQIQENIQDQNDEILALKSIFNSDQEDRLQILSEANTITGGETLSEDSADGDTCNSNMLRLFAPVKIEGGPLHVNVFLPLNGENETEAGVQPKSGVKLERSESGRRLLWSFHAHHLPPLCLHVTLGPTYPSRDPPSFVVSCCWLSPQQLAVLCRELDALWVGKKMEDQPGTPILFTWFDWLQENTCRTLGLEDTVSVYSFSIDEEEDDCRVVMDDTPLEGVVTHMMRYNNQQKMIEFSQGDHECGICFETLPGYKFFRLPECEHHVCRECMSSHCQLLVKDGAVLSLTCPSYKCKTQIPQAIIKTVLPSEEFVRYEELSLQKGLAGMDDIVWCPRCQLPVVQEPEEDLRMAHCVPCFFSFCTSCLEPWHQREQCKMEVDRIQKRQKQLEATIKNAKELAELRKRIEEEARSAQYVASNSSKCPKCNSPIMKIGGCNKVMCSQCYSSMCWICKSMIQGYDHFTDSRCTTFSGAEYFDNTDLNRPPVVPNPYIANARKIEHGVIERMLKVDPSLKDELMRCVACKQKCLRDKKHNHVRCWNCQISQCFQCKQRIIGPTGKHYSGRAACNQHG